MKNLIAQPAVPQQLFGTGADSLAGMTPIVSPMTSLRDIEVGMVE